MVQRTIDIAGMNRIDQRYTRSARAVSFASEYFISRISKDQHHDQRGIGDDHEEVEEGGVGHERDGIRDPPVDEHRGKEHRGVQTQPGRDLHRKGGEGDNDDEHDRQEEFQDR